MAKTKSSLEINADELKSKILDLAMRGKLVKQDPNDGDGRTLLDKARISLRNAQVKKEIRKEKYNKVEYNVGLPINWGASRLIEICKKENGAIRRGPFGSAIKKSMFVEKSNDTFKVYEQENAIRKDIKYGNYYMPNSAFERLKSFEVKPDDIIISCAGTIGETFMISQNAERGIINQALNCKIK